MVRKELKHRILAMTRYEELPENAREYLREKFDEGVKKLDWSMNEQELDFLFDLTWHFRWDPRVKELGIESCAVPEDFQTLDEILGVGGSGLAKLEEQLADYREAELAYYTAVVQQSLIELSTYPMEPPADTLNEVRIIIKEHEIPGLSVRRVNGYHLFLKQGFKLDTCADEVRVTMDAIGRSLVSGELDDATHHLGSLYTTFMFYRNERLCNIMHSKTLKKRLENGKTKVIQALLEKAEAAADGGCIELAEECLYTAREVGKFDILGDFKIEIIEDEPREYKWVEHKASNIAKKYQKTTS